MPSTVEFSVLVSRLRVPMAAAAAVALSACSSARFDGLDSLGYGAEPPRQAVRQAASPPVNRTAPVETVERGNADPTRYYPAGPYGAATSAGPTSARYAPPHVGRHSSRDQGQFPARAAGQASAPVAGGSASAGAMAAAARAQPTYRRSGTARWMGASWSGHTTTTQEPFDPERLAGAHATLPLPSYLYVTNRANGRTVLLRVNDRPPVAHGDPNTVVIVSRRVADLLDFSRSGTAQVDLQYAGPAGLVSSGRHEEGFLAQQPWFRGLERTAGVVHQGAQPTRETPYATPNYPRWDGTQR